MTNPSFQFNDITIGLGDQTIITETTIGCYTLTLKLDKLFRYADVRVFFDRQPNKTLFKFTIGGLGYTSIYFRKNEVIKTLDGTLDNAYLSTCEFTQYENPLGDYPVPEELIDILYRLLVYMIERKTIDVYTVFTRARPVTLELNLL